MNTANACFWTAFGFGILDWFIIVPNGLGAILGFIQMFLRLVVPSKDIFAAADERDRQRRGVEVKDKDAKDDQIAVTAVTAVTASAVIQASTKRG